VREFVVTMFWQCGNVLVPLCEMQEGLGSSSGRDGQSLFIYVCLQAHYGLGVDIFWCVDVCYVSAFVQDGVSSCVVVVDFSVSLKRAHTHNTPSHTHTHKLSLSISLDRTKAEVKKEPQKKTKKPKNIRVLSLPQPQKISTHALERKDAARKGTTNKYTHKWIMDPC